MKYIRTFLDSFYSGLGWGTGVLIVILVVRELEIFAQ